MKILRKLIKDVVKEFNYTIRIKIHFAYSTKICCTIRVQYEGVYVAYV